MKTPTNQHPIERIYPDDKRVKPQTIAHHKARYKFATLISKRDGKALDLACGTGYGSNMLWNVGYIVTGIDFSESAIDYARAHYPNIDFREADITNHNTLLHPWNKIKYDLIVLFEALEHLTKTDGVKLLETISGILNPDGIFIMSIPRDVNKKYNGFHKSNWDYKKLNKVLKDKFGVVTIYGQDWDTAKITKKDVEKNDFYIAIAKND